MGRKSAKIANKKGAADKARSQVYTKALKDVFKASKSGGGDPDTNFLLRVAVERAKKFNVPKDNIEKAIKKGQGDDGAGFEDVTYEGFGPAGVAVFIEASTDNPTRTVANIRNYFKKCDGALGVSGSLEFIFDRVALFVLPCQGIDEEELTLEVIDAGVEDVKKVDDSFVLRGEMSEFGNIQEKLQELGVTPDEASLVRVPTSVKEVDDETARESIEKLIELLEEDDDVVAVYHNLASEN